MFQLNKTYQILYWALVVGGLTVLCFILLQPQGYFGIGLFIAVALCGFIILICSIHAIRILPGSIPTVPLLLGLFLIISGTLFDVINTITHSPDLSLEANPIARFFLNEKYSVHQVYLIGFVAQMMLLSMTAILWAAFLKAYPIILQNTPKGSFWKTLTPLLGGKKATVVDLLIGTADPFFGITAITPILLSVYLYRWYLGFEWLQWVPISRVIVPGVIYLGAASLYVYFAHRTINGNSKETSKT